MTSTEFTIDGVPYLLKSNCEEAVWSTVCDRVIKQLQRIGKEAAKGMYGPASAEGRTMINRKLVSFKLTINPQGNPFNEY